MKELNEYLLNKIGLKRKDLVIFLNDRGITLTIHDNSSIKYNGVYKRPTESVCKIFGTFFKIKASEYEFLATYFVTRIYRKGYNNSNDEISCKSKELFDIIVNHIIRTHESY